jgi:hypothetical protein
MPSAVLLIAQVNGNLQQDIEITAGGVISGLLVLSALIGSLAMMGVWGNRIGQGNPALPAAARKPLRVPVPLMFCGLAMTMTMAAMVVGTPVSEVTPDEGLLTESVNQNPDRETSSSDSADGQKVPDTEAGDDAAPALKNVVRLRELLVGTLMMNLTMFAVFVTAVSMAQQGRSRVQKSPHDLTYSVEQEAVTIQSLSQFGEPDAPPDPLMSNPSDSPENSFAPPQPISTSAELADHGSATLDGQLDAKLPVAHERWDFGRELRFAFETFLVAYLPTAAVRILMMSLLPMAPSHPFLEMINEGVDWGTMSLIALIAVVVAPLVEELLYRVTILGGMMQQGWLVPGWIVSSLLFGFAHGFPDSIALLPLAFAIGYVYLRRRSYRTVMLVHLLFNGFNMVIAAASMI